MPRIALRHGLPIVGRASRSRVQERDYAALFFGERFVSPNQRNPFACAPVISFAIAERLP
jgi:hypothetical protein